VNRRVPGIVVIAATVLLLSIFAPRIVNRMADFDVYWTAAVRARAAQPLYRVEDGHYQFKYLPAFAVLAIPAGLVPLPTAKQVWFRVSVVLVVALIGLSLSVLPERQKPAWVLSVIVIVAMGKFYGHELVLGQVNLLFGVVALLAIRAMNGGREAAAGLLLALAAVVKPYALLFAPWLAARRRAAAIAAFAIGLVIVAALPAPFYGAQGTVALHAAWWQTVTDSTAPNLTNADNVSIAGMYAKWFGAAPFVRPLVGATSAALVAVAAFAFARRRGLPRPHVLEGALLLTLVPLLSPQGWDYVFLVSTPAIALLANYEGDLPLPVRLLTGAAVLIIGLSLYDVMGRANYAAFMAISIITVCFIVIVAALVTLRVRGVA
jgi:alpha-1,2-mannosyltransferase